jgi:Antistasin family
MRIVFVALVLALAGCPGSFEGDALGGSDDQGGSGSGAVPLNECHAAADCVPAGPKCCDCPTHAVPKDDPALLACESVGCAPNNTCGSPMQADCDEGRCVLVCAPVACDASLSCSDGFATDDNGCLVCACATATVGECAGDTDCSRVRADCCGCALGGNDTAIPTSQVAAYEAQLNCSPNPSCPDVNTCAPELSARCIAGTCTLVSGSLPPNACGRPDLPACPDGEVCTVNANDQATMQGVGVCQLPP